MGLPGHRRTSSHKRRRASHFALKKAPLSTTSSGATHRPHRAAPKATEYNGVKIYRKGGDKKLEKLLKTSRTKADKAHDHSHDGHDHA